MNRRVEAAVIENDGVAIVSEGWPTTAAPSAWLPASTPRPRCPGSTSRAPSRCTPVLRTQVDVVLPDGAAVLDASDPLVAKMASLCDGDVVFYDGRRKPGGRRAPGHRASRGARSRRSHRARHGERGIPVAELSRLDLGTNGEPRLDDLLAAIAAAWALGISADLIRTGIETLCTVRSESNETVVA